MIGHTAGLWRSAFVAPIAMLLCIAVYSSAARAGTYDDLATAVNLDDGKAVAKLVAGGLDPNHEYKDGNSLLMMAAREGSLSAAEALIKARALVTHRNRFGDTALMLAALQGHKRIVELLLNHGAPVDGGPGWTPLIYASFRGHTDIVELLLKHGANPDDTSPNGTTALMVAAKNGYIDTVRVLLKHHANPALETDQGGTAMKWAMESGNTDIADLLREAGAGR